MIPEADGKSQQVCTIKDKIQFSNTFEKQVYLINIFNMLLVKSYIFTEKTDGALVLLLYFRYIMLKDTQVS